MKRYSTSIDYKFWIPNKVLLSLSFLILFSFSATAEQARKNVFNESEKTIINSTLFRFRKECTHISILDENKLQEIQTFYATKKESLSKEQKSCLEDHLTQLIATHNIYKQSCDEITVKKKFGNGEDLARLFVNGKKFANGIRPQQEKLNECLIRNGAGREILLAYPDYEINNRALSQKIREMDLSQPFSDNSVEYR